MSCLVGRGAPSHSRPRKGNERTLLSQPPLSSPRLPPLRTSRQVLNGASVAGLWGGRRRKGEHEGGTHGGTGLPAVKPRSPRSHKKTWRRNQNTRQPASTQGPNPSTQNHTTHAASLHTRGSAILVAARQNAERHNQNGYYCVISDNESTTP